MELNAFQNEFRELSNKFKENERIIQKLDIFGTSLAEINAELDNLETVTKALSVDVYKAKKLAKTGETLMLGTVNIQYLQPIQCCYKFGILKFRSTHTRTTHWKS